MQFFVIGLNLKKRRKKEKKKWERQPGLLAGDDYPHDKVEQYERAVERRYDAEQYPQEPDYCGVHVEVVRDAAAYAAEDAFLG